MFQRLLQFFMKDVFFYTILTLADGILFHELLRLRFK